VLPEKLCDVFRPGVIVQADVSLRHYCIRSGNAKSNTFQLYMCGVQALGNAYESMPRELDTSPGPSSPKSAKRKAPDALFGSAPAKRRVLTQPTPMAPLMLRELNKGGGEVQHTAKAISPTKGSGSRSTRQKKGIQHI